MAQKTEDSGFRFIYWDDVCPYSNNNSKEEEENADSQSTARRNKKGVR